VRFAASVMHHFGRMRRAISSTHSMLISVEFVKLAMQCFMPEPRGVDDDTGMRVFADGLG
jgi:hypothetical protein